MTIFDYKYQNLFRFCFVIQICQSRWGLKNNSLNLHKETTNSRILVVVVKWRHRAIVLLQNTKVIIDINMPTRSALVLETKGGFCFFTVYSILHPNLDARILGIEQDADWINWMILLYFAIS